MKVKDVMVGTPASCTSETNLGSAVEILWKQNCGILPIVDAQQKVIGVVTDRTLALRWELGIDCQEKLPWGRLLQAMFLAARRTTTCAQRWQRWARRRFGACP